MFLTITSWAMSQSWAFVFNPHDVLPWFFFGGKVVRLVFQLSGWLGKNTFLMANLKQKYMEHLFSLT